ncbi:alpha/beta hydrolase [Candidatus Pelagibacter sp.]|nr:alpha/beta hydrolase [Candidatus Pelagibacter sp.]
MILEVDNKKVFISDAGQGINKNKDSIVLLHGSGLSHIVWSLTEQYLSNQDYNVLAIDLPGHGNSKGKSLKSIEEISDWLEKVFNELNISNITIIGHSQGCLEALEYYSKYSKRVKRLVFIGGSYRMSVNQDLIDLAEDGDDQAIKLMMKWSYENAKKFIGGNPVKKIINSPRDIREILAIDLVACNNYKNGFEALKSINCPTLFIFGQLDKMVNLEKGMKFAELIPYSETHIIKDCGHMIMFEKAFEMREKISEFLKK